MKNVAIIGAGLQGKRRLQVLLKEKDYQVKWVIDLVIEKAKKLASLTSANYDSDWHKAVFDKKVDIVLVLTYPDSHAEITIAAMEAGKDVLCEKPLAKTVEEAKEMVKVALKTKKILKCGFNHRHHPAIAEAYRLFKNKAIGRAIFGRGTYGIVGRKGLEKEWRSDPNIVGGGQLMEQGIHLIDLFRWFLGDFKRVTGLVNTNYWPIEPLEDNGFALLQNQKGVIASIHSSLTQWINLFIFEIYGQKGALKVEGLGGSYGDEKLIITSHLQNKPFSSKIIEYRGNDQSWTLEWQEFSQALRTRQSPKGDGIDGVKAMEIVEAVYQASKTGKTIIVK